MLSLKNILAVFMADEHKIAAKQAANDLGELVQRMGYTRVRSRARKARTCKGDQVWILDLTLESWDTHLFELPEMFHGYPVVSYERMCPRY